MKRTRHWVRMMNLAPLAGPSNLGRAAGMAAMGCPRLAPAEPLPRHIGVPKSRSNGLPKMKNCLGGKLRIIGCSQHKMLRNTSYKINQKQAWEPPASFRGNFQIRATEGKRRGERWTSQCLPPPVSSPFIRPPTVFPVLSAPALPDVSDVQPRNCLPTPHLALQTLLLCLSTWQAHSSRACSRATYLFLQLHPAPKTIDCFPS